MRSLGGMVWRSFSLSGVFVSPHHQRIRGFPMKTCMISPVVESVTEVLVSCKLFATQASLDEHGVAETNLNMILADVENAPSSTEQICTAYLHKLCKVGNISVAARLLQSLRNKNIFLSPNAYDLVMALAGEANKVEIVSWVFKDLISSCESLPSSSYLSLARGFINTDDHVLLLQLVKEVSGLTFPRGTMVVNRIIHAFAECRQFDKALLIFDQMKDFKCTPDLFTFNIILDLLGHAGRIDDMLRYFSSMKEAGIIPDFVSYNTLLNQLQKAGRLDLCLIYIREMGESGIEPDLLTYTALIQSFGKSGKIEESLRFFDDMKARHIRPSIYVYRSLINSAKKLGKVELAKTLLEEMNASLPNLAGPDDFKQKRR